MTTAEIRTTTPAANNNLFPNGTPINVNVPPASSVVSKRQHPTSAINAII